MDTRLEWHPTEAEVQAIIEELRPVLAAMAERQTRLTERLAPSRGPDAQLSRNRGRRTTKEA